MAGLRDRPLIRDALLAGGIIAAGAVAALIALDRGPAPRPHFGFVASATDHIDRAFHSSKSTATTHVHHAAPATSAAALPRQIGFGPPKSKGKSSDSTVVMMVPDLPSENTEPPTSSSGVWNDQGSAGPVSGNNSQPPGPIAMSAVGGISAPLTSPAGASLPSSPAASSGGLNSPAPSSPSGGGSPAHADAAPHSGFVLLAGGQGNGQFALASAELFDPAKNAFAAASSMKDAREDHTATVLPGGKILIVGGVGASGRALSSAELYDPTSGTFSAVASKMDTARAEHTATLISGCNCPSDGKILIAGGSSATASLCSTLRSAELYDPATGKFTSTGAMKATRARHSATLIASGPLAGNVLIAGGTSDESGGDVASAELYDPATGQFTPTGRMSTPRENHSATWLSPSVVSGSLAGNVLVAGGGDSSAPSDSAEVFNPQTAAFSPVGAMTTARTLQAAVLLANGKVLIAGGQSSDTEFLQSAELFDPAHATFAATGSMQNLHAGATATVLDNGDALIAGGRSNFADLYDPTAGTFSATGKMLTDVAESTSTLIR
ncbi:Kelch repeat-containing protein [Candidatus Binatus sp.]|uniref:Kelch repeat-containing protein n=1 Tax=Candidatus Binatus sp. TaxID=2811406 RepID=UPI003BB0478C